MDIHTLLKMSKHDLAFHLTMAYGLFAVGLVEFSGSEEQADAITDETINVLAKQSKVWLAGRMMAYLKERTTFVDILEKSGLITQQAEQEWSQMTEE